LRAAIDMLAVWLPILIILVVVGYFGWKQMREYRAHIAQVTAINAEVQELSRKNHEIAQAQLGVLQQIKFLLEDRKS
jgi:predicted negative regulator of RcsB-dependent stress response